MKMTASKAVRPPRVAFDTAVLLHALLLNDDVAKRLRASWHSGACLPLIAKASAQALMQALSYPVLALSEAEQHELLADFLPYAEVLAVAGKPAKITPLKALLMAAGARPDLVVSDSKTLAGSLKRGGGMGATVSYCRILDTESFLATL